jgi:hypothetical protein
VTSSTDDDANVEYEFLSHGLAGKQHLDFVAGLLKAFAETNRVDTEQLLAMATQREGPWADNRSTGSQASQLLITAQDFGRDGIITASELVGLLQIFRKFREAYTSP